MLNLADWLAGSFIQYCNGRAAGGVIALFFHGVIALAVMMSRVLDIGVLFVLGLAMHMHMGGTATAAITVTIAATSTTVVVSSVPMPVPMSSSSVMFAHVVLVRSIGGSSSGG